MKCPKGCKSSIMVDGGRTNDGMLVLYCFECGQKWKVTLLTPARITTVKQAYRLIDRLGIRERNDVEGYMDNVNVPKLIALVQGLLMINFGDVLEEEIQDK